MTIDSWHYELPRHMIAQVPLDDRASSKLLVIDREDNSIHHHRFSDIGSFLNASDCLILNNSRVISARLHGRKAGSGGKIEAFILRHMGGNRFLVLLKPKRKLREDVEVEFARGLTGRLIERSEILGEDLFELTPPDGTDIFDAIENAGLVPLPPYVTKELENSERYQTVYSANPGSVAAPTAGLHFTDDLLAGIADTGVRIAKLDLKVGWGTFSKVTDDQIESGKLHPEEVEIGQDVVDAVAGTLESGGKVVACGTTSVRALEACFHKYNELRPMREGVDLFVHPGFEFRVVDRMITNFHLPGTSLLMLVAAFLETEARDGREILFHAYEEAVKNDYRFYSFGDAMLIL